MATHCNTRHHTVSLHVTLQHAATQCNTLRLRTSTPAPGASERSAAAYTATLCNPLHHMASHGITLQHTITHCNTLQHTAPENIHTGTRSITKKCGNTTHYTAPHRNTLQHTATHHNTLQHTAPENIHTGTRSITKKCGNPRSYIRARSVGRGKNLCGNNSPKKQLI